MPVVNVSWNRKTSKEEKREFMDAIVDIISETTSSSKERIYVFIKEYEEENVGMVNAPVVQINWLDLPTRTVEARKEMMKRITEKLATYPDVDVNKVLTIITDTETYNGHIGPWE